MSVCIPLRHPNKQRRLLQFHLAGFFSCMCVISMDKNVIITYFIWLLELVLLQREQADWISVVMNGFRFMCVPTCMCTFVMRSIKRGEVWADMYTCHCWRPSVSVIIKSSVLSLHHFEKKNKGEKNEGDEKET